MRATEKDRHYKKKIEEKMEKAITNIIVTIAK